MTNYSAFTTMLSSMNSTTNSSSSSMFNFNFSDYASIRNGSYSKLMRAYYEKTNDETSKLGNSKLSNFSTSTADATDEELAKTEDLATQVTESAQDLYKNSSLFNKKTTVGEDGKQTLDYDWDAIYKKLDAFVDDYNRLIDETEDSDVSKIASTTESLIQATNQNEKMLSKIGITIGEDNSLKLDKDEFLKSDISNVKALFKGTGTYAYNVAAKASMIDSYAQSEALKANTYSSNGAYANNYSAGSIYNSLF